MEKQFETLEELVKDEDNIVTVPSYAIKAKIPYEKSCEVINKYYEVNKGSDNIQPTYVLTGLGKNDGKITVVQVNENTINDEKGTLKEVFSKSVFSIQKAKDINYNVITLVDPVDNMEVDISSLGAVVGKNCIKRTLHKKVLPTLPPATVKGKSTIFSNQNSIFKTKSNTEEVKKEEVTQKSTIESKPTKTISQGGIQSLFNKAAQNKKPEVKSKQAEQKPKLNGGISSFLSKTSSKTSSSEESVNTVKNIKDEQNDVLPSSKSEEKDDIKINEKEIKISNNKKSELFDSDTDDEVTVQPQPKPSKSVENNSSNKTKRKVAKKRSNNKPTNDKSEKKRKRIIVEDSESEDILGSDKSEEEDVIETTIYEEKEVKPLQPKNKRRKAVTKTFEDDEGFFVTQTEYVYETASEDENEPQNKIAKKEPTKQPLEKKLSNNLENEISPNKAAKGKKGGKKAAATANQPTLMNFFKKK